VSIDVLKERVTICQSFGSCTKFDSWSNTLLQITIQLFGVIG